STDPPEGYAEVGERAVVHQMKEEAPPASQPAVNPHAGKPVEELEPLLREAEATFKEAVSSLYVLIDAEKRNAARDTALPAMREFQQIAAALPERHLQRVEAESRKFMLLGMRAALGDEGAMEE